MSDPEYIDLNHEVVYDTTGHRITEDEAAAAAEALEHDDVDVIDVSYPREDRTRDSEQ